MITQIKNVNDVVAFAKHLVQNENLSFHPDDDFRDYVKFETNQPFYSETEAALRNKLMNDCFEVCNKNNVEIYELVLPIIHKQLFA